MKRVILSLILISSLISSQLCFAEDIPNVRAKGAVLIEAESGRVLFEKNAYESLPMASTTKIMTCILALEEGELTDVVTVSKRATRAPAVKLNLKEGEKQLLGDLLYSLMLQSHNDSAVAIAEHIGGSVESFCEQMTDKAKEIGATHTSFKTPNGLDAEGHYASAYDMALIAAYALKNPEFVKIVTTQIITIPTIPVEGSHRHDLQCKNRFLYSYPGANGVKTGFTNKAGHCFVGGAVQNDMQLIGAALASGWGQAGKTQKYTDVINMMNYGFKNYKKVTLLTPQKDYGKISVTKALIQEVPLECDTQIVLPLTGAEQEQLMLKKVVPTTLEAPITKGDEIGEVQIWCQGEILARAPLKAQESVKKATVFDHIRNWINKTTN